MSSQMDAEQMLAQVLTAREAWTEHGQRDRHDLVKIQFDRWVDERTPVHLLWNSGPMDQLHLFQRDYAKSLLTVTVFSPFASDLYGTALGELTDLLLDIERSYEAAA